MNSAPGPYHFPADSSKTFKFDFFNLVGAGGGGEYSNRNGDGFVPESCASYYFEDSDLVFVFTLQRAVKCL